MTKLLCVPFDAGRPRMSPVEEATIVRQASLPPLQRPLHDAATVLVVIGYVDAYGDAEENKRIAFRRAQMVIDLLHDKCQFAGSSQATTILIGDLLEKERGQKEKMVEVWMVDP